MAQFLLGLPTSGSIDVYSPSKNDSWYDTLFIHDDWHARPNLTINMGLRWEYGSPTTESHNRQSIGFDPAAANQVAAAAAAANAKNPLPQLPPSQFSATGGLLFASSSNRSAYTTSHKSFAPRFGISWTPGALHNKTMIRAGTGIFYYNCGVLLAQQPGFGIQNQYVATNNSYLSPATTLSNPFPNGISQPPGAAAGINTYLGQSVTYYNPNLQNQYSLRWTWIFSSSFPTIRSFRSGIWATTPST